MKNFACLLGAASLTLGSHAAANPQEEDAVDEEAHEEIERLPHAAIPPDPDTILVSAARAGTVFEGDFFGSATIIGREEMENRQARDVADVLRDVPGVAISAVAGQTQVRLRGTEANHVLVLVDGIEVSDPFASEFDLGTLQIQRGSSVEVLRGPQSALYGSDAVGGVIAYRSASTKLWRGLSGLIEGGTDGILNAEARYAVGDIDWGLSLTGNVVSTDGQPNARGGARPIGRDSYTISVKGDWEVTDHIDLRAVGRYVLTEGDFNDSDFDPASPTFGLIIDSPGTRFENEALYGLVGIRFEPAGTGWTHDLSAQFADIARDTFNAFGRSSGSEGDRLKASYVTSYEFGWRERQTITGALDWEREGFRNTDPFGIGSTTRQEIQNVGIVADYRLMGQKVDLAAAVRHDINDRFADETTFKLSAAARINQDVRLRGSIGSGTKNPGFFELFGFFDGRFIGNEDLQPEKSTEWEVGLDWELDGRDTLVSLVYFESELENEIFTTFPAPDFVATPANRDTVSRRKGVELSMNAEIGRQLSVDAAYSYLDAEEDGVTEVRRPDHIASAALNWTAPGDTASATLVVRHNGAAEDLAFTDPSFIPVRVALDDYTLVNLNARVRLAQGIEAFGRVENLLDETYEQVFSFVSPGRSAVVGLQASF